MPGVSSGGWHPMPVTVTPASAQYQRPCEMYYEISFPSSAADLFSIQFQNYYCTWLTVKARARDDTRWRTVLKRRRLMDDAHYEDDAQDWHSIKISEVSRLYNQLKLMAPLSTVFSTVLTMQRCGLAFLHGATLVMLAQGERANMVQLLTNAFSLSSPITHLHLLQIELKQITCYQSRKGASRKTERSTGRRLQSTASSPGQEGDCPRSIQPTLAHLDNLARDIGHQIFTFRDEVVASERHHLYNF
jgi:hypothetical protein